MRALDIPIGGVERGVPLLERRLRRRHVLARILDLLAGGDAALEQLLRPLEVETRVLDLGLRLLDGGRRLPALVFEGPAVELGDHLTLAHAVPFGDGDRVDASGDQRADLDVLVRHRGDASADEQVVGERAAPDLRDVGDDRRHLGGLRLVFLGRFSAAGGNGEGDDNGEEAPLKGCPTRK